VLPPIRKTLSNMSNDQNTEHDRELHAFFEYTLNVNITTFEWTLIS